MQAEKRQLESQLLRTAGEVAVAERQLSGSHSHSLDSEEGGYGDCAPGYEGDANEGGTSGRASGGSSGEDESSDDVASLVPRDISRLAERSAREAGALRAENQALMTVRA